MKKENSSVNNLLSTWAIETEMSSWAIETGCFVPVSSFCVLLFSFSLYQICSWNHRIDNEYQFKLKIARMSLVRPQEYPQMRTRRRKFRFHLFLTRWKCGNVGWPYGNPIQISVPVKSMQRHSFNFSFVLNFNLIGKFCWNRTSKRGFLKKTALRWVMYCQLFYVGCWE